MYTYSFAQWFNRLSANDSAFLPSTPSYVSSVASYWSSLVNNVLIKNSNSVSGMKPVLKGSNNLTIKSMYCYRSSQFCFIIWFNCRKASQSTFGSASLTFTPSDYNILSFSGSLALNMNLLNSLKTPKGTLKSFNSSSLSLCSLRVYSFFIFYHFWILPENGSSPPK